MNSQLSSAQVRLLASAKSWIEGEAIRQLYAASKFEGVRLAVGFPDLHPGRGTPVGAAFVTEGVIYPHIIGSDIGCGMALFKTSLLRREAKVDRWAQLRFNLELPFDEGRSEFLAEFALNSTDFDKALGTVGGGNHFAELQAIEQIIDVDVFKQLGVGKEQILALIHSGSRGLGETVLRDHASEHGENGLGANSVAASEYLRRHDFAVRWAKANRELIARRFTAALGADAEPLCDGCHNSITRVGSARCANRTSQQYASTNETAWLHRKGAVPSDSGFAVIPGSRGSLSYIVKPIGDSASHAWSLAHGAGRKWSRSEARLRIRERFGVLELVQTPLGSRVICEERDLLYEEAPAAYKNIEVVIQDLVDVGLVSVIATLRPLLTYKTRKRQR